MSCCVACRVSGLLWVGLVPVLPLSVRGRMRGGEGWCVRGVGLGLMSHRRLPSLRVSWRVFGRGLRTYGWSWLAVRLWGRTPWGWSASASMASHAACSIRPSRRLGAAVLRQPPAGPADQALEGGPRPAPLLQLPELRVGPALPPLFRGGAVALGGGARVGVGVCGGVMGTGGSGGRKVYSVFSTVFLLLLLLVVAVGCPAAGFG